MKMKLTEDYLILKLQEYAATLGRTPKFEEMNSTNGVPSGGSYKNKFGSWNRAVEVAGLKTNTINWNIELISQLFLDNGCVLISDVYVSVDLPLDYICKCGNKSKIRIHDFIKGMRCDECGRRKCSASNTFTYKYVKEYFEKYGCTLISKEYMGSAEDLEFLCACGKPAKKSFSNFQKQPKCQECTKKSRIEKRKLDFNFVQDYYSKKGCILLDSEYINNNTKMSFICSCGNIHESCFDVFKRSPRCPECGNKNKKHPKTLTLYEVKFYFEENDCILLSTSYGSIKDKLDYICKCGRKSVTTFDSFRRGVRCRQCGIDKCSESNRHSIEYVQKIFSDKGCILLTEKYQNGNQVLDYICECGNIGHSILHDFISGGRCKICANKRKSLAKRGTKRPDITGSNHPQWDATKTPEEREKGRFLTEYKPWRSEVYKRDNYTCQRCGDDKGGNLNAHHLDGWDWCKDKRFDISNGITLCNICHDDFHQLYGYGNNTKEQWEEYMTNLYEVECEFELIY